MEFATSSLSDSTTRLKAFVGFMHSHVKGYEKSDAQIVCDRLF